MVLRWVCTNKKINLPLIFSLGSVQTKGACLVPKRGLDVMTGEVNRLLQLTSNAIIPITYQVPRKVKSFRLWSVCCDYLGYSHFWCCSIRYRWHFVKQIFIYSTQTYREFHADIFPETPGYTPSTSITQWLEGANVQRKTISLDPSKRPSPKYQVKNIVKVLFLIELFPCLWTYIRCKSIFKVKL